ncbi:MAG TPA: response regulator [Marmoricola sp.]|nr:response regulator [Marmoricola sp.]
MPIRVLLVDDVVEVRRLVRTALRFRGGFEVVAEASDGTGAVRFAAGLVPDVIVLDLGLPDLAGHEVLSRIREASPASKVVIFSGNDESEHQWIEGQVEGYVLKDTKLDYLVDLLESVARRATDEAHLELPRELTSVRLARRFVAERLAEWGLEAIRDDALLVTSELAANAITHAHSACRLRVSLTATTLRIDVIDMGSGTPEPQPPSDTEEHGRGLHLVAAVTTAWGLEMVPQNGKVVWAELSRPA